MGRGVPEWVGGRGALAVEGVDLKSVLMQDPPSPRTASDGSLFGNAPAWYKSLSAPGTSLHIASLVVDTAWHYMTHGASFFFIFRVRQTRERYIVLVLYGLTRTGYRLWIFNISATPFAICHKTVKIALNGPW